VLDDKNPKLTTTPDNSKAAVAGDPLCPWSAAWRAAAKSGLEGTEPVDARYAVLPDQERASWVLSMSSQPQTKREIDGQSCVVKLRR
jgi:hypothetical protein